MDELRLTESEPLARVAWTHGVSDLSGEMPLLWVSGRPGWCCDGMRRENPPRDTKRRNSGASEAAGPSADGPSGLVEVVELGADGEFGGGPEDGVYVGVDAFDDLVRG